MNFNSIILTKKESAKNFEPYYFTEYVFILQHFIGIAVTNCRLTVYLLPCQVIQLLTFEQEGLWLILCNALLKVILYKSRGRLFLWFKLVWADWVVVHEFLLFIMTILSTME